MSKIVFRTLDVFEAFAREARPLTMTELAKMLDIPMSSCHDVVQALEERGYLYQVRPRGALYPTMRLYEIARGLVANDPVAARAEPLLQRISLELNVAVSLAIARDLHLTYLVRCNPPDPLRYNITVGTAMRILHATSGGKALLGSMSPEQRKQFLANTELKKLTPHTKTSVKALMAEIAESEQRGWFVSREEAVEDALTVATRFTWADKVFVVTAAGSVRRMERQFDTAVALLRDAATQLGDSNGRHGGAQQVER